MNASRNEYITMNNSKITKSCYFIHDIKINR